MRPVRLLAGLAALGMVIAAAPAAAQASPGAATWTVHVRNLTPAGSQPLSPPVFVVHSAGVHVWRLGEVASHGVAAVAEDANNSVLVGALSRVRGVRTAFAGAGGPIAPGGTGTYKIKVRPGERVSIVSMLVNTNDGFTGVDSLKLRGRWVGLRTRSYDAGSEQNVETKTTIPGPCCGNPMVRVPEGNVIRMHPGITGRGDLSPTVYGWREPIAKLTFARS